LIANKSVLAWTAVLCALAWAYVIYLASRVSAMSNMPGMAMTMPAVAAWGIAEFAAMLVMWAVMMAAMMLPSVMPVISLYARVGTKRAAQNQSRQPTWPFVTGYLLAWAGFSVLATLANWGLHSGGYLTSMMGSAAPRLGGIVLIAAGVYQWTPLKNACLSHCRSPLAFLADHWREGRTGALTMGLEHGAYCVGCCWFLMALLFVLGVMNVAWIAVLTVFILVEKMVPFGKWWSRGAGAILVMWGAWLVSRP
jgi:predicted metal-binding membrane protein